MQCIVPKPSDRIPLNLYLTVREWLICNDPDGPRMLDWSRRLVGPPATPEDMAFETIWIILCAGRSAQAARTIERRVIDAIRNRTPVVRAFGYKAKAEAIERAWRERNTDFERLTDVLAGGDPQALIDWCGSIPFIGNDTKYQLARNFGADVCKPDIWLCRLAGIPDRPRRPLKVRFPACMGLCTFLSKGSGDRIGTVDAMLWLACNKRVLDCPPDASRIQFSPAEWRGRGIMT